MAGTTSVKITIDLTNSGFTFKGDFIASVEFSNSSHSVLFLSQPNSAIAIGAFDVSLPPGNNRYCIGIVYTVLNGIPLDRKTFGTATVEFNDTPPTTKTSTFRYLEVTGYVISFG